MLTSFIGRPQIARDKRDRFGGRNGEQCVEANARDLRLFISGQRLHAQRDLAIETGKLRERHAARRRGPFFSNRKPDRRGGAE
jgi:hypothetical protein